MAHSENVVAAAQEEAEWDAIYHRALAHYKESGHFAEDVAEEIDEAIEQYEREKTKPKFDRTFIINQPVIIEETRHTEFKEVKGANPVGSIVNAADEYTVAFLNREGGSIFWGIRNADRVVVGVSISNDERDKIRRLVSEKFATIQPPPPISQLFVEIYPVLNEQRQEIEDLWVLEVFIPAGLPNELYATGSGAVFIKTDAGKLTLKHTQILAEYAKRNGFEEYESKRRSGMKKVFIELHHPDPRTSALYSFGPREVECKKCGEIFVVERYQHVTSPLSSETITCPGCGSTKRFDLFKSQQ